MAQKRNQRQTGSGWLPKWKRIAIYLRDEGCCQYCGQFILTLDPQQITLDHLICWSHGGSDTEENLITACKSCNSARGTKPWRQYATGGAVERILKARRRRLNKPLVKMWLQTNCGAPASVVALEMSR